jgi:hypothetical protein
MERPKPAPNSVASTACNTLRHAPSIALLDRRMLTVLMCSLVTGAQCSKYLSRSYCNAGRSVTARLRVRITRAMSGSLEQDYGRTCHLLTSQLGCTLLFLPSSHSSLAMTTRPVARRTRCPLCSSHLAGQATFPLTSFGLRE